jgi:hypothetical protein
MEGRRLTKEDRQLYLILGPGLLTALALEHADCAPVVGIEHGSNHSGLLAAIAACSDRIGIEAARDLVFEVVVHVRPPVRHSLSIKVNSGSVLCGQNCKMAWNDFRRPNQIRRLADSKPAHAGNDVAGGWLTSRALPKRHTPDGTVPVAARAGAVFLSPAMSAAKSWSKPMWLSDWAALAKKDDNHDQGK